MNYQVTYKTEDGKSHVGKSVYKNVQQLLDFLSENPQYNYAGFVEFADGVKIKGVQNENHFIVVYGRHAKRCFFIGRGGDTWNGIYQFGGRNWGNDEPIAHLNPDDLNAELLNSLPIIK